jgi:pimeloyl-[acyl-carrier protein] methyl ester esterase
MNNDLGKHWLLLRGLSREAAHWGEFPRLLQARFPDSRISTLDLPGSGSLYLQSCPADIGTIMHAVRQQAAEQGLAQQPLTLLGLSLGGMLAWDWLQKYPDEISGAVLINSSFADLSPFYQRMNWRSYPSLLKILLSRDLYQRELAIIRWVANNREQDEKTALAWEEIQRDRPVGISNSLKQIIAAARYRPGDSKPKRPVLILNSAGDRLAAPVCSQAISEKWHLPLRTHSWAGHDLPLDDGGWVDEQLRDWISQVTEILRPQPTA